MEAHTLLLHAGGNTLPADTVARGGEPAGPAHRRLLARGRDMRAAPPFPAREAP
ncbi:MULTISPECIES: hypothetical protein [unclassified Streptomyces]|uniref:hypothetical protein n=1 Tax=unclassified Streptomyces TaxID=2593676 RepID=UPI000A5F9716|nr:hypothetical protein [Streptomyces sp. TSRI0281]